MVLLPSGARLAIWPLHIYIRVRIAQQYLNVHLTSLIKVEFLRFHQGLYVTSHAHPILLAARNYIAEALDSTGTDSLLFLNESASPAEVIKSELHSMQ